MPMLLVEGVKYKPWTPKDEEKEFHPIVKAHFKEIFGEDCLYFDIKHRIKSKAGIGSIPDAYVIRLSKPYEWYVVEIELATHPIYDHIVKQLTKFLNGLKSPESRSEILEVIDEQIGNDKVLKGHVEKTIGSAETYRFLSTLLSHPPRIVVVIDELNDETREACESLRFETSFVELKTFIREDAPNVRAFLFEPLESFEEEEEHEEPPHRISWEKRLKWVDNSVRTLVTQTTSRIEQEFPDATHLPKFRWLYFYKGKKQNKNSLFAVLLLSKKEIEVRIRTEPRMFKDDRNWTKKYRGWFFYKKGQEKGFRITNAQQLDYAIKLIKQSYKVAG